ncbi:hypothetical protein DMN91_006819 [Ooceraea biroi]|uniref:Uncharacterized protein n=1 Tax=Ooceraea biroi TaxID=2015173 RepID=A0A026WF26_OOCBI|nr:uncharacterized protein LOC113562327 [Ooceraea biroi]EZA54720.1 hypothetical protein X777_05005 [Ooceraea biroi]RLU20212.1 hypothetical protein DMN91_006819 [Ooceraea biroi]
MGKGSSIIAEDYFSDRPWEIEVGKMSNTELLSRWISHVRRKKRRTDSRCNFRKRAMLTYAANSAEVELRTMQLSRLRRWKTLRKELLKGIDYGSCCAFNMAEQEQLERTKRSVNMKNVWQQKDKDLLSLDNFLQKLCSSSQAKRPGNATSGSQASGT